MLLCLLSAGHRVDPLQLVLCKGSRLTAHECLSNFKLRWFWKFVYMPAVLQSETNTTPVELPVLIVVSSGVVKLTVCDENDGCYRVQHMHCIVTVWTVSLLECSLSITELLHNCVHTCSDFQVGAHIFTKWKGCILHTGQSKIERISYYDVLETEDSMLKSFTNYCPCHCYKCFSFSWRVFVTIVRFF